MIATPYDLEFLFRQVIENEDSACFEQLFKSQYASLCMFARKYLLNDQLAEEAVSEVFCKIWRNRLKINIKTSAKYYLFTSVRNMAIDMQRQGKKFQHSTDECLQERAYPGADAYESLIAKETQVKINSAIQRLPPQCRTVFQLSRFEGLKYHEIALQMNISIKTVETQMTRALKQLRGEISYQQ